MNTLKSREDATATNDIIRRILKKFQRSSYVGYTATPFANIFIHPDSEDEMRGDDLFPHHFIKALDAPTNYVGADRVFSPEGNLRDLMVRFVTDYADILPLRHKASHVLEEIPASLKNAIRCFVLVRAMRILRGDGAKHCSMMVNVSRLNNVQEQVHGLVYEYQKQLDDAIRVNSGLATAFQNSDILELQETFNEEFSNTEFVFSDLIEVLRKASQTIEVRTVNMRRGDVLDYDRHEDGLHVIAIGGLALSRGLTLEGLAVSYVLRTAGASDTLMQMARWFGYRRNFEDLCRLYICKTAVDHYEYIADAVEELRGELKRMELRGDTPEQFGLKVRRSETGIRITAANKMRSARQMLLAQSFDSKHLEGYALENDASVNSSNLSNVVSFLEALGKPARADDFERAELQQRNEAQKHLLWRNVDGAKLIEMVKGFRFHGHQPSLGLIDGHSSLFIDYCLDRIRTELSNWDVAVPLNLGRNADQVTLDTLKDPDALPLRARNSGKVGSRSGQAVYKPTGDRNSIRDPNEDPVLLLTEGQRRKAVDLKNDSEPKLRGDRPYCAVRDRPLMLIHFFTAHLPGHADFQLADQPIVTLSFCMPRTEVEVTAKSYEVNEVYRRQLETLADDVDDDQVLIDE